VSSYKVGDRVWAQATVKHIDGKSLRLTFQDDWTLWFLASDCRPVEPVNPPKIPDNSSDPIKVGDAVRFVLPGHKRHGAEGIILSIVRGPNHQYRFDSNCGKFHRYCTASELELITKRYREPTLADLANGPIACEYRDCDEERWRSGFLVHILNGAIPFLCVDERQELFGQWDQCRIEVGE
jgi:hypothetical protein